MPASSAGIVLYRRREGVLEVLLAHPGGPFWHNRDKGAWTIPKGLVGTDEAPADAARREFEEEIGPLPPGELRALGRIRQRSGKWVEAFALPGDFDISKQRSDRFELEWPPRSGNLQTFPEVDRAQWFALEEARWKLLPAQTALLDRLAALLPD